MAYFIEQVYFCKEAAELLKWDRRLKIIIIIDNNLQVVEIEMESLELKYSKAKKFFQSANTIMSSS